MSPDESPSRRDTGTEATSDPRRPWWPVGLALLGLVAVVLVGGVGAAPTAAATLPGVRVATSPLEREIEDAYYRSLQVYSDALLNLDTSRLSEVLDGEALRSVAEEVD